jgi:hypothetical protein
MADATCRTSTEATPSPKPQILDMRCVALRLPSAWYYMPTLAGDMNVIAGDWAD